MARLVTHVSVRDADGVTHSFGPDSDVPDWAAAQISNPKAWEDSDVPFPQDPVPSESDQVAALRADNERLRAENVRLTEELEQLTAPPVQAGEGPPPRAGRGSGEDKWRAYAAEKKIDLPADIDGRDEIIAFLDDAGVPVE